MRREMRDRRDAIARKLLHSGKGLVWREALSIADDATKCGAKTMAGTPCQRKALTNGKCIKHGGGTPKKTQEQKEAQRHRAATQPRVRGRWAKKIEATE